jgi:hypothetical protein
MSEMERIMDLRYRDLTEDDKRVLDEMDGEAWESALVE